MDQAKLLQSLGIDGIIIGNTRFLSPLTNKRKDEYGGSLENRMRFIMDVCRAVKQACGPDFIISHQHHRPRSPGGWLDPGGRHPGLHHAGGSGGHRGSLRR